MNTRARSLPAFTILEMAVALSVMGVFFLIAGTLFVQCVKTFGKVEKFENRQGDWRQITMELGRDVWSARRIRLRSTRELLCRIGPDLHVRWRIGRHGNISRVSRRANGVGHSNHWPDMGEGISFRQGVYAVELCRRQRTGARTIVLPAEMRLLTAISGRRP